MESTTTTANTLRASPVTFKRRTTFGTDVGTSNWGFAGATRRGFVDLVDEQGQVIAAALPDSEVLTLERWDLKQGRVLTHTADWEPVHIQLDGFSGKGETMADWRKAMSRCVKRCDRLFQTDSETGELPNLVTENQCDMVKTDYHHTEMQRLAEQFQMAVQATDLANGRDDRRNCYSNCKYLLPNDNTLTRMQRKMEEQAIVLNFLEQTQQWGPLKFLRTLLKRGEQIHDMTDALGLLLHWQNCEDVKEMSLMVRQIQALKKSISAVQQAQKKKRVKKNLLPIVTEKQAADGEIPPIEGEETDEAPLKKKAKKKPVPTNTQKRGRQKAQIVGGDEAVVTKRPKTIAIELLHSEDDDSSATLEQ